MLLPIIISLILGIAAGYAGFRFFGGDATSEIASRDNRIAELERVISDLRFNDKASNQQETVFTANIDDLKQRLTNARQEIESLKTANQSLATDQGAEQNRQLADARNEIEALHQTLAEAGNTQSNLDRANKSLRISELQIIDLEKTVNDQARKMAALERELGDRSSSSDKAASARIAALNDENAALKGELAAQKKLAAGDRKILEDSVSVLTLRITQTEKKLDSAQASLSLALADLAKATNARDRLAAQKQKLDGDNDQLQKDLAASAAEVANIKAQSKALSSQVDSLTARVQSLRDEVKALKAAAEAGKVEPVEPKVDTPPADSGQTDGPALTVRDVNAVTDAMAHMPNIDRLSAEKQSLLKEKLVQGACVTDSLEAVFDRVPVIALRNLIRDLRSPC